MLPKALPITEIAAWRWMNWVVRWRRDISVSYERIGGVLAAQGDGTAALASYNRGLQIREALATHDPANIGWQRDLSVDYDMIGRALAAQGDRASALASYSKSLGIREALAARDRPSSSGSTISPRVTTRSATC
jgi:predicted negative regulator of RcsB-dependent stress response